MVLRSNERVLTKKVDSFPLSSSFHIHGLRLLHLQSSLPTFCRCPLQPAGLCQNQRCEHQVSIRNTLKSGVTRLYFFVQLFKLCRPAVLLYSALPGGHKYISRTGPTYNPPAHLQPS
jgi:hypothetical protein